MIRKVMIMRVFTFFLFILLGFTERTAFAQQWTKAVGDTAGTTSISSLSLETKMSVLVSGGFSSAKLPLGSMELNSNGEMDAWVAEVDMQGEYLWAKSFGGTGNDRAVSAISDSMGNTYVAGNFSSLTLTIGDTTLVNNGESDGFVLKLKPNKSVEWVTSVATSLKDEIVGLVLDKNGHLYIGGHTINNPTTNSEVAFIIKMDGNKTIQWIKKAVSNTGGLAATSIALNDNGICYLAGGFNGNLKPDGGNALNSATFGSAFVLAYNTNGVFQKGISADNMAKINSLKTFDNEVLICGEKINYGFGWDWPLSDSKIFVAKYDQNLNKLWDKNAGGDLPFKSLDIAKSIALDVQGNVYVTGYFFSPKLGFASDSLPNVFNKDYFYQQIFVLKYDANGNEIWGKSFGGNLNESGDCILALDNDQWFLAGQFESDTLFLQDTILMNNGKVTEYYVHLKPKRLGRNPLAFLSYFNNISSNIRDDISTMKVQFYPNPASQNITLRSEDFNVPFIKTSVYTIDGRLIHQEQLPVQDNAAQLVTPSLTDGMYLLVIETGSQAVAVKFLKK